MLGHVPIVNGSIRVTRRQHLCVSAAISHIDLTVIDVVLVEGILGRADDILVDHHVAEENSAAAKGIAADARRLSLAVTWVE